MKNRLYSVIFILLISNFISSTQAAGQGKLEGRLSLSGAFALYPMAIKWAEEFKKINPAVKIDISAGGAGKGMTDVLNNMVDIGMVSREIYPEEEKKGALGIAVTKDAVVAVMSENNPLKKEILAVGLKQESANDLWITGKIKTWGEAFKVKSKVPIHVYTRSDACGAAEVWAKLFGQKQEDWQLKKIR